MRSDGYRIIMKPYLHKSTSSSRFISTSYSIIDVTLTMTHLRRIHHQQGSHTFHDHQAVYMDEISRNTTLTLTRNHHLDIILQTNIQQIPSKMAPYKTEEESIRPFSETKSDFVEKYVLRPVGKPLTKEYRVYFNLNDKLLSLGMIWRCTQAATASRWCIWLSRCRGGGVQRWR